MRKTILAAFALVIGVCGCCSAPERTKADYPKLMAEMIAYIDAHEVGKCFRNPMRVKPRHVRASSKTIDHYHYTVPSSVDGCEYFMVTYPNSVIYAIGAKITGFDAVDSTNICMMVGKALERKYAWRKAKKGARAPGIRARFIDRYTCACECVFDGKTEHFGNYNDVMGTITYYKKEIDVAISLFRIPMGDYEIIDERDLIWMK